MVAPSNLKMKINFGPKQFIINCNDLTFDRAVELAEKVAEVRMKESYLQKYPMDEEENREKWLERISPLIEKERSRKDGETVDQHIKRISGAEVPAHKSAFEIINCISSVFQMPPVTKDEFKTVSWVGLKNFIFDVLSMADVDASEFAPKQ